MSTQFPPSSPLRSEKEYHDPFALKLKEGRGRSQFNYPTPHPSSSAARSSSPVYGASDHHEHHNEPKKVSFEVDKPIMNVIDSKMKIIKVALNRPSITLGRSSKTSDIAIRTNDRSISRNHLKVSHTPTTITLECLGANGFGITIPRACKINKLDDVSFELTEVSSPLIIDSLMKAAANSTTIKLHSNFTEFVVRHGESLTIPKLNNIIVEIKDFLIIINPRNDSEETDDELPVMETKQENVQQVVPLPSRPLHQTPNKLIISSSNPNTPVKSIFQVTSEESTPVKPSKKTKKAHNALQDITNHSKKFKKSKSEEPTRSLPMDTNLDNVENVQEISNILVNHLAFSRLSSTAMSILRSISANIDALSDDQLKLIMSRVPSIGVINREGKDAAGKPLEQEYYYIPENDDDESRKQLVNSIKGHGGIRSCRRTHKQYYWKKPAPIKNKKPTQ